MYKIMESEKGLTKAEYYHHGKTSFLDALKKK